MSESPSDIAPAETPAAYCSITSIARLCGVSLLPALFMSLGWTLACRYAAGPNLGLFLGALVGAALLTPPLVLTDGRWIGRLLALLGLIAGPPLVWLTDFGAAGVSFFDGMRITLVLAAFTASLGGLALMLYRIGFAAVFASAMVVAVALSWLSWPVWTAPWLHGRGAESLVAALVAPHPLFAINGGAEGPFPRPWAQYRYAYRLTTLGDHLNYSPPASIVPCVLFHGVLAGACLGLIRALDWRRRHRAPIAPVNPPAG
jgi:hypothetical protein